MPVGRISWIDVARGIGIILVIYGHALSSHSIRYIIYSFHMPLFFFLSGLLFNYKKNDKFGRLVIKSAKAILIPYVLFALLSYIFWMVNNVDISLDLLQIVGHLTGVIYGNSSSLFFNIVLWFLPCLFITKIFFGFITKVIKNEKIILMSLVVLSVTGYGISVFYPGLKLPFGLETAISAVVFFGIGSVINTNFYDSLKSKIRAKSWSLLGISFMTCVVFAAINFSIYGEQIDMRLNHLGNYFLFYGGAFSGIIFAVLVSKLINKSYILELLGVYSLVLFATHSMVFYYLTKFMEALLTARIVNDMKDIYFSPIYTAVSIIIILTFVYLYKRLRRFRFYSLPKSS